jgi:hypothetical protein
MHDTSEVAASEVPWEAWLEVSTSITVFDVLHLPASSGRSPERESKHKFLPFSFFLSPPFDLPVVIFVFCLSFIALIYFYQFLNSSLMKNQKFILL